MARYATHCIDCGRPVEGDTFFNQINPRGGYGRDQILVCDPCIIGWYVEEESGRWVKFMPPDED